MSICKFDEGPMVVEKKKIKSSVRQPPLGYAIIILLLYIYFFLNLNLYLIPRAKYILQLQRTESFLFLFYNGTRAQRKPYGDVYKMNEHDYPCRTAATTTGIRINFFPHFVFTPFARIYIKNKSQPRDLFSTSFLRASHPTGVFSRGRC